MNEKAISRIEKLFVHAESAHRIGSQAEAEAFAAKARELMVKHKLELVDLDLSGEASSSSEPEVHYVNATEWGDREKKRSVTWREALAWRLAPAYFCKMLRQSGRTNGIIIIGAPEDKDAFLRGFQTLLAVAEDLCSKDYDQWTASSGYLDRTWKTSWYDGFVKGVHERVQAEMLKEKQNLEEHALVAVKDQMAKVENTLQKHFPRVRSSRSTRTRVHYDAQARGRKAGKQSHNNRLK